ncbi:MAG TPA: hypothetical protein VGB15_17970 [Longimicrobium sp.]|jgi:hypothetical protein
MDELQRRLLNRIYSAFRETGEWPRSRKIELEFADEAEIDDIADDLGFEYVMCENPSRADAECRLGIRGLAECDGAEDDIRNFLSALPLFAEKYKEANDGSLSTEEIQSKLGIDSRSMLRLTKILREAGRIWSSCGLSQDGSGTFTPNRIAYRVRNVKSIDEFYDTPTSTNRRSRPPPGYTSYPAATARTFAGSEAAGGSVVQIQLDLIRNADLRQLLAKDLRELELCFRLEAWKAVGVIAGSCCEAILLELLGRDPQLIPEKDRGDWQRKYGLKDLARVAGSVGLLAPLERTMAEHLKEWRDLVHPIRQIGSPRPTQRTAKALISVLELLSESLDRAEASLTTDK